MIKKIIFLLMILVGFQSQAQVGINTTTPKAQLEIKSTNEATPANTDGLLIPKINAFPVTNPTVDQQGMLVYLTTAVGVNTPGFYYWNNPTVAWIPVGNNNNSNWKLTGNSGTNPATNFIGTTDNQDVVFRRFNFRSGLLGISNTSFGFNALNSGVSGGFNTAFGAGALDVCSTGYENTAVGYDALGANTTGFYNTAFGRASLLVNTDGFDNSAYGYQSLRNNLTGNYNAAFGRQALLNNTTGESNVAIGKESLKANTTGSFNTAIGYQAFLTGTLLENATAIGSRAQVDTNNSLVLGSIAGVNGATSSVNVGIGTTSPLDRLHVVGNLRMVDGNQAVGKVLTSDANGTATWTTPVGTGGTLDQSYDFGGAGVGRTIIADTGAVTIAGTDGLVSTGTFGSGALVPSGASTRMVWNPRKAAFRAGRVLSTQWDDANIGLTSTAFGENTIASGSFATALGSNTNATGSFSTAFGSSTIASGATSTAFGVSTIASGSIATAFGVNTTASGDRSTAFGAFNTASSFGETVFGIGATTYTPAPNGATQFRSGNDTDRLFVIGNAIDANNNNVVDLAERSNAMQVLKNGKTSFFTTYSQQSNVEVIGLNRGITNDSTEGNLHIRTSDIYGANVGGSITIGGAYGGALPSILYKNFASIEARKTNADLLDEDAYLIFKTSAAAGLYERMRITAEGNVGIGTTTPLDRFHLVGNIRMVDGNEAEGKVLVSDADGKATWTATNTFASGNLDQAYDFGGNGLGRTIIADAGAVTISGTDGLVSTGILGDGAIAPNSAGVKMFWNPRKAAFRAGLVNNGSEWADANIGDASIAFGNSSMASGENSTAFGNSSIASGFISTAFGDSTNANGNMSTAFGRSSYAEGNQSTAFGFSTTATGENSTAFGQSTTASGFNSTAFGNSSTSSGEVSTAFGRLTTASGNLSTALGQSNTASSYAETTIGIGATTYTPSTNGAIQFNTTNATDRLFVIGNAIDSNNNFVVDLAERRDAMVVLKNGNIGIGSSTPQDKLHIVGNLRMVDGNQAAGKVLTSDANGTATWQNASANAWSLTGNSGTNSATNFIGTTDNTDLVFRRFNVASGRISTTNSSFGFSSLFSNTTGGLNSAFGVSTLRSNTTGFFNSAFGDSSLFSNTTGSFNSAFGVSSLRSNTIGDSNSAFGESSLLSNTTGSFNSAFGVSSLRSNTIGDSNSAFGQSTLRLNTTGSNNSAFGLSSLNSNTTGNLNSAFGTASLNSNTTGEFNSAFGESSLRSNTTGLSNSTFGSSSLFSNTIGNFNSAFGKASLFSNTTGDSNSAFGFSSLGSNTTGNSNSAFGASSLNSNTTGLTNSAFGVSSLISNITGSNNSAFGSLSLFSNTTGEFNSAFGSGSMFLNTIGSDNTAFGRFSLTTNTIGIQNTAIGSKSDVSLNNLTNATAIGANAQVGASNSLVLGSINGVNDATATVNVGIGTTTPLERLHVAGRAFLTDGFSADNAALVYRNDTDYMFLGPQSGSSADGGALALYGSTNVSGGNAGGIDLNVPNGQLRMTSTGNVGIGTTPTRKFHVSNGSSGGTANVNAGFLLESSTNVYQHFLTPNANESGLLFGSNSASIHGGIIFDNSDEDIVFRTGGNSNRVIITNAGDVGIGALVPGGQLELSLDEGRKPGTGTWTLSSDKRLKTINGKYTKGLNEILQLNPILFNYKNNGEHKFEQKVLDTEFPGFIAQEVQPLFPDAVGTDADGFLNFNIHPILIASINAFKELNIKNQAVEYKNRELELKLKSQEQIINNLMERLEKLEAKN